MARSDDLVPLFTPPPSKGVGFRQGVIVAWNPTTAENTVSVGDALVDNLPILNTSEAAILAAGDVVGILTAGSTWGILGRFTIPGTPEAVTALSSLRTQSQTVLDFESVSSLAFGDATSTAGPEVEIAVGASGRLIVLCSCEISGQANAAAGNTMTPGGAMGFRLSGANTLAANGLNALRISGNLLVNSSAATLGVTTGATKSVLVEGLAPGLTTVTAQYARIGSGTGVNVFNRNLTAIAI